TREADKLVKVWRTDGQETWVLIHVEVQSQYESVFAERIYVYNVLMQSLMGETPKTALHRLPHF
ncbi:MAG: hypothetical protein F6K50_40605, partial [Moorea sp. SIO3I7]|nr:hypothetical protein [Moorena sp. SIO3I7]